MKRLTQSHWSSVAFVLFFPLLIMVVYSDFVRDSEFNARAGWFLMLGGLAYLAHRGIWQKLFLSVLALFTLSGALDILYAVTFGGVFTDSSFEALAETNTNEGVEFLWAYASLENVLLLSFYLVVAYFSLKSILFKTSLLRKEKFLVVLAAVMLLVALQQMTMRERTFDTIPGFTGIAIDYAKNTEGFEASINKRLALENPGDFSAASQSAEPQTYVVVIGESATRNKMSLYGYLRETTPELNQIKDELIVFDNVISAFAQTTPSLSRALTQSNTDNNIPSNDAVSVVGVLKKAGFKVWWLSNQQPRRIPFYGMALVSDEFHYVSNDHFGVNAGRYDGLLNPHFDKALADPAPKKVIFLHTMGSHLQYENRYPPTEAVFTAQDPVNAYAPAEALSETEWYFINGYDNSIRYADKLVGDYIAKLKQQTGIASLLYFSDHGEEVFDAADFKGHGPDNTTANMAEVPFVIWRNSAYQQVFSSTDQLMQTRIHNPGLIEDFFQFMHCWTGTESEFYQPEIAVCDQAYQPRARMVYGKDYDSEMRQQP